MKLGVNALLWMGSWKDSDLPLLAKCKQMGFDVVEIPLFDLNFDAGLLGQGLGAQGLEGVGCIAIGATQDVTSSDPAVRAAGVHFLKQCVDKVAAWGGSSLGGVMASAIGKNVGRPANADEWKWSAESLRDVARYAAPKKVSLGLEVINRYETYFVNTLDQAAELIGMIGEPNVKILADTYHMNMEEKDFYHPLVRNAKLIGHIHFVENDRGVVGSGHVDWPGVFQALKDARYSGAGSIETFVQEVPEIAAATNTWRRLAPNGDALAIEGLAFLRKMASEYQLA